MGLLSSSMLWICEYNIWGEWPAVHTTAWSLRQPSALPFGVSVAMILLPRLGQPNSRRAGCTGFV